MILTLKNRELTGKILKAYKLSRPWIMEHLSELQAKGWTKQQLFNAGLNLHKGTQLGPALDLAWLQPGVKVRLSDEGAIIWSWPRAENKFTTQARCVPSSANRPTNHQQGNRQDRRANNKKTEATMTEGYINLAELKRRGWTIKLIEDFKPEHDKEAPNPINPDWAPQKLYDLSKIKEIEKDKEFQGRKKWANSFQDHMMKIKRKQREAKK